MAEDGRVVFRYIGDTSGIDDANNAAESKMKGLGTKVGAATAKVAAAVGAAAVAVGTAAVKVGSDFEKSMSQVSATMGYTAEDLNDRTSDAAQSFARLEQAAMDAGSTTKYSASEASEALNYLALAGYDVDKSIEVLPKMLNAASAANVDLAYMSDLVTDGMSALGLETNQLDGFLDQMTRTSQKSNTSIAQLGEAILTVGGTAKVLKGGTEEMNTVLGVLADNGIKGSEGGTALRNVILSLTAPTKTAAEQIEALGLSVTDAEGNMRALPDIMQDLNAAMSDMSEADKTQVLSDIFNKVDLKSVNALLGTTAERFADLSGEIADSAGATEAAAKTQEDNLQGMITIIKSQLEGLAISVYKGMEEPLKNVAVAFSDFLTDMSSSGMLDTFIDSLAQIATVLGNAVIDILPVLIDLINTLLPPIMDLIQTALPPLLDLINTLLPPIMDLIQAALPPLLDLMDQFMPVIKQIIQTVLPPLLKMISSLLPPILKVVEIVLPILLKLLDPIGKLLDAMSVYLDALMAIVTPLLDLLEPVIDWLLEPMIKTITRLSGALQVLYGIVTAVLKVLGALFGLNGWDEVGTAFGTVKSGFSSMITSNAGGTPFWRGGRTWVGEMGPEIVDLPMGSRIYSADVSARMASPPNISNSSSIVINGLNVYPDSAEYMRILSLLEQADRARQIERAGG